MANYIMEFQVLNKMAFLSHLELMKVFRQGFRRSALEVRFSEGFNPHMKLSFAIAKGVGLESHGELLEIETNDEIDEKTYKEKINDFLPEGINVIDIREKTGTNKSLSALLKKAVYSFCGDEETIKKVTDKLNNEQIIVRVKTKRKEEERNIKE